MTTTTTSASASSEQEQQEDAILRYVHQVQEEFRDEPRILQDFVGILNAHQTKQISSRTAIRRVSTLFHGNRPLILGFRAFLPEGSYERMDNDVATTPTSTRSTNSSSIAPQQQQQQQQRRPHHHPSVATTAATQQQQQQQKRKKKQQQQQQQPLFVQGPSLDDLKYDTRVQTCVVCLENVPNCIAIPCLHLSYCVACARQLCFGQNGTAEIKKKKKHVIGEIQCCVCRQDVHAIQRVHHS